MSKRLYSKEKKRDFGELLMINYYFPPVHVAGAIRLFHFHAEAKKYFQKIRVITSANVHLMRQDPDLQTGNNNIHFIPTIDLRRIQLLRKKGSSPHLSTSFKSNRTIQFLQRLADSFPFSLVLADGGLWYIWKAYQKGKRLVKEGQITHIFSSFRPMADHWVAFLLKKRFPRLYWIADFRDLPVDPARKNVLFSKLQKKIQAKIIKGADLSTTVSNGLSKHLKMPRKAIYVLPNCLPTKNLPTLSNMLSPKFTISYTGSIYPDLQCWDLFFSVVKLGKESAEDKWENLRIVYAGKDSSHWELLVRKFGLETISINYGLLSISEAEKIQKQSHINLLMTWSKDGLSGVFTTKMYSYLSAGRPILGLVKGMRDKEIEGVFESLELGKIYSSSQSTLSNSLLRDLMSWYQKWCLLKKPLNPIDGKRLKKMRWDYQFSQLRKKIAEKKLTR